MAVRAGGIAGPYSLRRFLTRSTISGGSPWRDDVIARLEQRDKKWDVR